MRTITDFVEYTYTTELGTLAPVKRVSIGSLLGYNVEFLGLPVGSEETVRYLMIEIADIERLISEARLDGMATKVEDITIDFGSHIARMKIEGSQKVKTLSQMVGIPIKVNIFTGEVPKTGNNAYQVRSTPYLPRPLLGGL